MLGSMATPALRADGNLQGLLSGLLGEFRQDVTELPPGASVESERQNGGVWKRRYPESNEWEQYLVDNGIHVVEVALNRSKREQAGRFLQRIDKRTRTGSSHSATSRSGSTGMTIRGPSRT